MLLNDFSSQIDQEEIKAIKDKKPRLKDIIGYRQVFADWEARYRENDEAWRKKYKERFYSNEPEPKEPEPKQEPEPEPPKKFEDLFTTKWQ